MQTLFSPDSKFMQVMSRICDLMVLNFLFLLSSLPVFTIGAAVTALYTCCFQIEKEQGIVKQYFAAFRENFRQSTVLWLILLLCGGSSLFNALLFFSFSGVLRYAAIPFGILFVLSVLIGSCVFPLQSRFSNNIRSTFQNAFVLSIGYLPRFAAVSLLQLFPFLLLFSNLYVFFQTGFIWVSFYFSSAAYVSSLLLKKVFAPYLPPEEAQE